MIDTNLSEEFNVDVYEDSEGLHVGKKVYRGDIDLIGALNDKHVHTKIKDYGNGYVKRISSNKPIFCVRIPKPPKKADENEAKEKRDLPSEPALRDRSKEIRRNAIERMKDIILLNEDLKWFFTVTFNDEEVDALDPAAVFLKFNKWLQNQTSRKGLKYLIVPEYHPNGKTPGERIHFHGLINDALELVDSDTRLLFGRRKPMKLGKIRRLHLEKFIRNIVYNVKGFKLGHTTAIPVQGTRMGIALYITKYLTKAESDDSAKIFGKYYWSSKNLNRDPVVRFVDDGGLLFFNDETSKVYYKYGTGYKYENHDGDFSESDLDAFLEQNPFFSDRLASRSAAKEYLKLAHILKYTPDIEAHKEEVEEFERFCLRQKQKREKEEAELREKLERAAAKRYAAHEWKSRQISFFMSGGNDKK